MPPENWIAVDWGTSNLRLWRMSGDTVTEAMTSDKGMASLAPDEFEPHLLSLIGDPGPGPLPVLVCGMAGARQGWAEAPYLSVPTKPPSIGRALRPLVADDRLDVRILPGLSQAAPADVMRGEETQVAGFMAAEPRFDGILCLPGTHSKWVHVSAGEVVSFRTFMTGELFALLSTASVLRHSIGDGWDDEAFLAAVSDAMGRPAHVAADLFTLRAAHLLHGQSPDAARARLSGLLIGMELAAARPYWLGQEVVILGAEALSQSYLSALRAQSATCRTAPVEDITLRGLIAAWKDAT